MVKERAHKIYTMSTIKQNHTRKNTKNNFPSLNKILTNQQNQSKTLSLPLSASLPMLRCYSRINISILDSICHHFRMSVFFPLCVCWGGVVVFPNLLFIFLLQKIHASLKDILWLWKELSKPLQIKRTTIVEGPLIWHSEEKRDQLIPFQLYKENIHSPYNTLFFEVDLSSKLFPNWPPKQKQLTFGGTQECFSWELIKTTITSLDLISWLLH